jgi:hypothetical protein
MFAVLRPSVDDGGSPSDDRASMLHPFAWLLVASLAAGAAQSERGGERAAQLAPNKVALVHCTPQSISAGTGAPRIVKNPIAQALAICAPGGLIELAPGDYPSFAVGFAKPSDWNAATSGGTRSSPITVRAMGDVRIVPRSSGDTIAIAQQVTCGYITFEGLTIVCGYRAGVMFYKCGAGEQHQGFRFRDCNLDGGFDHVRGEGQNSKWGVWGHSLADFEFRGVRSRVYVRNLRHEHGFYIQNSQGDVLIEKVDAGRLGRTFVQFTARPGDGPPGRGTITVRDCSVEDVCIARGDDYKGGSAFTVAGRHAGKLVFERNRYRAGFVRGVAALTREGVPYGTGAFVAWDARGEPNGTLILRDNDFEFAAGCGDRPVVSLGGCREVQISGKNRFVSGGNAVALEIDPPPHSVFASNPIGKLSLAPETVVVGSVRRNGEPSSLREPSAPAERD